MIYVETWVRNLSELQVHRACGLTLNVSVFRKETSLFRLEGTAVIARKKMGQGSNTLPKNSFYPKPIFFNLN